MIRATKALLAAGIEIARIEVAKDGSFAVVAGKPGQPTAENDTSEKLRELL